MTPGKIAVRGGDLYTETFAPAGAAKGSVLVSHGYMEHCGRYHELASVITKAGWAVMTYDVRGHGKSFGRRGYVDHFAEYLDDFRAAHAAARKLAPDKPLVLLGHSHGSLITLRALCGDDPPEAVCAIVASPYLGLRLVIPGYKKLLTRLASRVAPGLAQTNGLRAEDLTHDPAKQQERIADKLCFDVATARWFVESSAAQSYVAQHADRITVPTTWLVGGDDPIADPAESRRVATRVPGASYHDLRGMRHEVFNELDRAQVFTEVEKALATCGMTAKA